MSPADDRAQVRSYQRIFRPERRIYQVEGHRLPVPGGVPLRWLGYAIAALMTVIALGTRSPLVIAMFAGAVTLAGVALGTRATALVAGLGAFAAAHVAGFLVVTLDWPMRLVVLPALVATLATHAAPDGRATHRFVRSWIAHQLRPERRSLSRPTPSAGEPITLAGDVTVARDQHGPTLRRARLAGPAVVRFVAPVHVGSQALSRRSRTVRGRSWRRSEQVERVELAGGERLEVRP